MILVVDKDLKSQAVPASSFHTLGIWERKHIQEWIRQCPELLGEDLLVVSQEFDRFVGSDDRLDLLAVDRLGNLVVVEFKRDSHAGYADLQAIRYASMVSTMTVQKLLPYFAVYLRKTEGESVGTIEEAESRLRAFVNDPEFFGFSDRPRVILCSQDFGQELTTSVLWLRNFGLDVSCVKIVPHATPAGIVVVPTKIIPLEEAQTYMIDIREKQESSIAETEERKKNQATMTYLLNHGVLKEGDEIFLKNDIKHLVYEEGDPLFHATITGKRGQSNAIRWSKDGQEYSISGLTWEIFRDTDPNGKIPGGINGNWHWVTSGGTPLWDLAQQHRQSGPEPQTTSNGRAPETANSLS